MRRALGVVLVFLLLAAPAANAGYDRDFEPGSLIIPMDLAYQDHGIFQAYGLLFQLLRQGITVYWIIDLEKIWHHAPCDTVDDECSWDCHEEDSGIKCPYPTGSPDFYTGASVVWDGEGQASPGDIITRHGYRGGPFVIESADKDAALAIVDVWNDPDTWADNPWAERTVFQVVSVHERHPLSLSFQTATRTSPPLIFGPPVFHSPTGSSFHLTSAAPTTVARGPTIRTCCR
jgi:hypothetical protein